MKSSSSATGSTARFTRCSSRKAKRLLRSPWYVVRLGLQAKDYGLRTTDYDPMIKSMTGFGRGSAEGEGVKVTAELRTVNNRHLDVHVRMSQEFADLELAVKKQV